MAGRLARPAPPCTQYLYLSDCQYQVLGYPIVNAKVSVLPKITRLCDLRPRPSLAIFIFNCSIPGAAHAASRSPAQAFNTENIALPETAVSTGPGEVGFSTGPGRVAESEGGGEVHDDSDVESESEDSNNENVVEEESPDSAGPLNFNAKDRRGDSLFTALCTLWFAAGCRSMFRFENLIETKGPLEVVAETLVEAGLWDRFISTELKLVQKCLLRTPDCDRGEDTPRQSLFESCEEDLVDLVRDKSSVCRKHHNTFLGPNGPKKLQEDLGHLSIYFEDWVEDQYRPYQLDPGGNDIKSDHHLLLELWDVSAWRLFRSRRRRG